MRNRSGSAWLREVVAAPAGILRTHDHALLSAWKQNPHPCIARAVPTGPPFDALFTGKLQDIQARLAKGTARDPRLSNELERVLRDPPWSSDTSRPVWSAIFKLVRESKDPRFVELAKELPVAWAMRAAQKEWLTVAFTRAVEELPPLTPLRSALSTRRWWWRPSAPRPW